MLLQSKPEVDEPGPDDLHWVGTSAAVLRYVTAPDGAHHASRRACGAFACSSSSRAIRSRSRASSTSTTPTQADAEIEGARARAQAARARDPAAAAAGAGGDGRRAAERSTTPAQLADLVAGLMDVSAEEKQALLETFDLKARLDKLLELLAHRIEVLKLSREIDERTRESIGDVNRKHLLREQMRTIQKELGEGDEGAAEIAELDEGDRRGAACPRRSRSTRARS